MSISCPESLNVIPPWLAMSCTPNQEISHPLCLLCIFYHILSYLGDSTPWWGTYAALSFWWKRIQVALTLFLLETISNSIRVVLTPRCPPFLAVEQVPLSLIGNHLHAVSSFLLLFLADSPLWSYFSVSIADHLKLPQWDGINSLGWILAQCTSPEARWWLTTGRNCLHYVVNSIWVNHPESSMSSSCTFKPITVIHGFPFPSRQQPPSALCASFSESTCNLNWSFQPSDIFLLPSMLIDTIPLCL